MKYKSVLLTKRGGPEVLKIVENEFRSPSDGEVQIKMLACGVGLTDVAMRNGYYPFAPKIPFVPGYEIVGIIESKGNKVSNFSVGDMVAALTIFGGYSEYIYLDQQHLIKVPKDLDPGEAVALILNYTTAYQMLNRVANVKQGNKILIIGASGGVGTALLDLSRIEDLTIFGTASYHKHDIITQFGAFPIDYKSQDFVEIIQQREPGGLDFVFDSVGGLNINKSFRVLSKRGKLIEYGYPSFRGLLKGLIRMKLLNISPNGKTGEFYGISSNYKKNNQPVLEDIATLFNLLKSKKIKPVVNKRMPLLKAAEANRLLESGTVSGKIVLMAPELSS